MKVSYAITCNNERFEVNRLIKVLSEEKVRARGDEIIVQFDSKSTIYSSIGATFEAAVDLIYQCDLSGDFASFKNTLKQQCKGDFIFFLDADEYPHPDLLISLPAILEMNPIDLILVPRTNLVHGITDEHIKQWGWVKDENERINWPDYQTRIIANKPEIHWENKVHERIVGYKTISQLPASTNYSLYHIKSIEKQEKQNNFYYGFTN
jgi:glycosyltransferase involved in cell wall biosynthesis